MRLRLAVLIAFALASSAAAQTPAPAVPFVKPPPPGQLLDIGGRRLHILCKGAGDGPTVIFEAGLSQYTAWSTYTKAQDAIAPFARVCTYDRAGLGWSDPVEAPTHAGMVADLHRLLAAAKAPGPYILVGHSMGGILARRYAQTYPKDVAGIVLVDSTPQLDSLPEATARRAEAVRQIDAGLKDAKPGQPIIPLPAGTPPDAGLAFTPEILLAVKEEYLAIERSLPDNAPAPNENALGDRPLIVIRRGRTAEPPSAIDIGWRRLQEQLPNLSRNSLLIVAEKSGHVIPLDEPAVVADAVRQVLNAHQTGKPLKAP